MSIVLESLNKKRYILNERIREIKIRKKIPILEKTPRTILKKIHSDKKLKVGQNIINPHIVSDELLLWFMSSEL